MEVAEPMDNERVVTITREFFIPLTSNSVTGSSLSALLSIKLKHK